MPPPTAIAEPAASSAEPPDTDLLLAGSWASARWLVRLRWRAIFGVLVATGWAVWVGGVATPLPLILLAAGLTVSNLGFWWWARPTGRRSIGVDAPIQLYVQLSVDVVILSALLHQSGTIENPFVMLFALQATLAGLLLPYKHAVAVASTAVVSFSAAVLAAHLGLIEHHGYAYQTAGPGSAWGIASQGYVATYLLAFAVTVFVSTWLTSEAAAKLRQESARRAALEQLAATRERLAQVGAITAGVAHSVRNPLQGLMNCADLLRASVPSSPASDETFELMESGLQRIEALTRGLLKLSRPALQETVPTDLHESIDEALRMVRFGSEHGLPTVTHVAGPPVVVEIDPARMAETLASLVDNAVYACTEGGSVEIRVLPPDHSAGLAVVEIRDTGTGVPQEYLDRVFQPFFSTKPPGTGTGLGLALSKQVVEALHGHISLTSDSRGTVVCIHLPPSRPARLLPGQG